MRARLLSVSGALSAAVFAAAPLLAQVRPRAAAPPPVASPATPQPLLVLPGYLAALSGATMEYHAPHPDARTALLARAMHGIQSVAWTTDTVPAGLAADTVSFVWIMGLSGSKGVRRFDLSVGGERRFSFETAPDSASRGFVLAGANGSSFAFRVTMVDRYGDLFGYATLRLARTDLAPGRPLALEVRGEDAGSRAWYMTFQHRFSAHPRITQDPVLLRGSGGGDPRPSCTSWWTIWRGAAPPASSSPAVHRSRRRWSSAGTW